MQVDRYKQDLEALIERGEQLHLAIQAESFPERFERELLKQLTKEKVAEIRRDLPSFNIAYQAWYSESKALIRQLLPDRIEDFVRLYEKPKSRKEITYENYTIADHLQGLTVTRGWEKELVVGPDAAIPAFRQQLAILGSVNQRFVSTLFDIRQLVQADLFDSELDAASALLTAGYVRPAGVLAGVVIERHLAQVARDHKVAMRKKNPAIADWNEALKAAEVIDVPQWRSIQHLADVRNLCGHSKEREPTSEEVEHMIVGVTRVIKSVF